MSHKRKQVCYLVPHAASKSVVKVFYGITKHIIYLEGVQYVEGNVFNLNVFRTTLQHAEQKYCRK